MFSGEKVSIIANNKEVSGNQSDKGDKNKLDQEDKLTQARIEVDRIVDMLGEGVDENIKECLVAFRVANIPTMQSCEGHVDNGLPVPWILVGNDGQPDERYIGQSEVFQEVADERGVSFEDVKRSIDLDGYYEAMRRVMSNGETQQYKEWEASNEQLTAKMRNIVKEFYQNSGELEDEGVKIKIDDNFVGGICRVYSGQQDYKDLDENLTDDERVKLQERLEKYRTEMNRFAQYLIENHVGLNQDKQTEKERVREIIESLPVDAERRMELALVVCGEKLATEIEFRSELSEDEDKTPEIDENLDDIVKSVEKLGLIAEVFSRIDEHDIVAVDGDGNPMHDEVIKTEYSTVKTLQIFKDEHAQKLFHQIDKLDDLNDDLQYKIFTQILGELYQFPKTAIEAFNDESKRLTQQELPDKVRKNDWYHFATFVFSRDNWQEETKTAQKWAHTTKEFSPKIYQEYIDWAKE